MMSSHKGTGVFEGEGPGNDNNPDAILVPV